MTMNFLTRYHPRFVRSLIYMLQSSEYSVHDYLKWYHRTANFLHVERRKKLEWSAKATLLYTLAWVSLVAFFIGGFISGNPMVFALSLIASPFLLAYTLCLILLFVRIGEWPIAWVLVYRAKKKLVRHKALRIAIAGSYGKTSMREILKTVLGEAKKVAAPPGSYNTPLGIAGFIRGLTGNEEVLIFELGEYYRGDVKKLCELVLPSIGLITGINEAHLEKFGTLKNTTDTIFELADFLKEKAVYVNEENDVARGEARESHILYGRGGAGNWSVENGRTGLDGTSFTFVSGDMRIHARSKLLGLHQIGPLAAAADIATRLGISSEQIEKGISKTSAFAHRLEPKVSDGVTTLDDSYNGSPDGVKAVIEFLAQLRGHQRWYVTPGLVEMGSRKEDVHREIGRQLAHADIEKVVLIKNSVTLFIADGLKSAGFKGEIIWFDDALKAYAALPTMTVPGDIVLLQNDWPDSYA